MPSQSDPAPTFTATFGTDETEDFDLADHVGNGPVVLAFFPGAFTPPCTNEMATLQEEFERFENADATLFGVSADSPFALGAFAEQEDLSFDLVSDMERKAIDEYDVETSVPDLGLHGVANRAVFVIDEDETIAYAWEADEPANEPDYDALLEAVESVAPTM